jgi:hypothetical protein
MAESRSHAVQVTASLIVALVIVAVTIAVVTAKLGPNLDDDAGRRDREEDNSGPGSLGSTPITHRYR